MREKKRDLRTASESLKGIAAMRALLQMIHEQYGSLAAYKKVLDVEIDKLRIIEKGGTPSRSKKAGQNIRAALRDMGRLQALDARDGQASRVLRAAQSVP